jgi:acetate kinase
MKILVLNAGSSSQKSCLYELSDPLPSEPPLPLWSAHIDWADATLHVKTALGKTQVIELTSAADRHKGMQQMLQTLWSGDTQVIADKSAIACVGHRVVHGGQKYQQTVRIDATVKSTIAALIPLAPAHNPANLEGIELVETLLGSEVPQFAVFDTAFHSHIPDRAAIYPGPHAWVKAGIRRYGFHGTSHAYCADRAAQLLGRDFSTLRLINCHLDNGCSLAAIQNGYSVDTTMGFTPLEGLMMGSRSGSVDPGILLYLMREQGYDAAALDEVLNQQSGLKGLSGISPDLRLVQAAMQAGNRQAQLAWDVYIHRIRAGIGAMRMSLDGLDALMFTAGVGENNAAVRSAVCEGLGFLGIQLDETLNQAGDADRDMATLDSPVRIFRLHTQEDWQIAKSCWINLQISQNCRE